MHPAWGLAYFLLHSLDALDTTADAVPAHTPSQTPTKTAVELSDPDISFLLPSDTAEDLDFHVPTIPIDLKFTFFGRPTVAAIVSKAVEIAIEQISAELTARPNKCN